MDKDKKEIWSCILFMSYLVFGFLGVCIYPILMVYVSFGLSLGVAIILSFVFVVGLHYLIEWLKDYTNG